MSDKMIQYIMDRRVLDVPQFSLRKILGGYDMAMYEDICIKRIAEEVGMDGVDVIYDFVDGQVHLTHKGIKMCESVLSSYCNADQIAEILVCANDGEKYVINSNNMIWQLRHKSIGDLKELLAIAEDAEYTEAQQKVRDWVKAEIKSRSVWNRLRLFLQKQCVKCVVQIRYYGLLRNIKQMTQEYMREVAQGAYLEPKDRPEVIHNLYTKYCKISPKKRSKEETRKYVFYWIVDSKNREQKYASDENECFEIEARYETLKGIVTAAAELTPRDFLSLFPVDKKYDGEKYGWKDYFYTMRELKRFPMNEKIGDRIIPFLEIYTNKHVFKFIVDYFICIGDYSAYCGVDEPKKEYFRDLNMWQEVQV